MDRIVNLSQGYNSVRTRILLLGNRVCGPGVLIARVSRGPSSFGLADGSGGLGTEEAAVRLWGNFQKAKNHASSTLYRNQVVHRGLRKQGHYTPGDQEIVRVVFTIRGLM